MDGSCPTWPNVSASPGRRHDGTFFLASSLDPPPLSFGTAVKELKRWPRSSDFRRERTEKIHVEQVAVCMEIAVNVLRFIAPNIGQQVWHEK